MWMFAPQGSPPQGLAVLINEPQSSPLQGHKPTHSPARNPRQQPKIARGVMKTSSRYKCDKNRTTWAGRNK